MPGSNSINKIAIVGAGGRSGQHITAALLHSSKFSVTAITRPDSISAMPEGLAAVRKVDYEAAAACSFSEDGVDADLDAFKDLVDALRGQHVLIISLAAHSRPETELALVRAAGEAGVKYILPSEWGCDTDCEALVRDVSPFKTRVKLRNYITSLGKSSYISVSTGFWYEWSLGIEPAFGFDLKNRRVVLFDEGDAKISISTWPQVGRAVTALLSLPIQSQDEKNTPCLEDYKNKVLYVSSFAMSQRDMLATVLRVTKTSERDWEIIKTPARERFQVGLREIEEGNRVGFIKMMYTRVFFDDGVGYTEDKPTQMNRVLGLNRTGGDFEKDESTLKALERAIGAQWNDSKISEEEGSRVWSSRALARFSTE